MLVRDPDAPVVSIVPPTDIRIELAIPNPNIADVPASPVTSEVISIGRPEENGIMAPDPGGPTRLS